MKKRNLLKLIGVVIVLVLISLIVFYFSKFHQRTENPIEIVNNEFISRVLDNDLTYENLKQIYSPKEITETSLENDYDKVYHGKILSFKTDTEDVIEFYKNDNTLLEGDMVFVSQKVTLDHDIKIGVDKSVLGEKFQQKITSNKFIVTSLEGYIYFVFSFENDKLSRIEFQIEYID